LTPSSGNVGSYVRFDIPSSPFTIDGNYQILWSRYGGFETGSYSVLTSGTLPRGSFSASIRFKVPEASYGVYYVQFYQDGRTPVTLSFILRPSILLTPSSAKPGSKVSVKGTGFPATDYGSITMKNDVLYLTVDTDSLGTFSETFTVPDLETGSHTLTANTIKLGAETAQATLQVLPRNEDIIIYPPETPADPPPEIPDNNSNGGNVESPQPATPVTNTVPPKPVIISPRDDSFGWFGEQSVTFTWGPVPEPEDVTYTLEIGENFDFNPPIKGLQMTRLTTTSFHMEIPPGTYYWRVRAVDSHGNEGDWAYAPYAFKVGQFPLAPVMIGVIILIVIILLISIIKAAKRKSDNYYY
jgi:hypothetical protein